jgi:hypothetical protein
MALSTTLTKIHAANPGVADWERLLKYVGKKTHDVEALPYELVIRSMGVDAGLRLLGVLPPVYNAMWRKYAVWCLRSVEPLMPGPLCRQAVDVLESGAPVPVMRIAGEVGTARGHHLSAGHALTHFVMFGVAPDNLAAIAHHCRSALATAASTRAEKASVESEWARIWRVSTEDQTKKLCNLVALGRWN